MSEIMWTFAQNQNIFCRLFYFIFLSNDKPINSIALLSTEISRVLRQNGHKQMYLYYCRYWRSMTWITQRETEFRPGADWIHKFCLCSSASVSGGETCSSWSIDAQHLCCWVPVKCLIMHPNTNYQDHSAASLMIENIAPSTGRHNPFEEENGTKHAIQNCWFK